jgi:hypothetical protein
MACWCWRDLTWINKKAEELSKKLNQDVQIYEYLDKEGRTTYGFEAVNANREKVIKLIAL